ERIDAWADACKGVEYKVFMGGLSNYGFSKGFGIRRGFVEMYLYHIPDEHIGQKLDNNNYLYVDETSQVIAKNVFQGEENEEYEEKWADGGSNSRFGALESFPYRYFTANLRLLQMRVNYLLNNEFSLLPEMLSWVSLEMGRTIEDAPDAWCFLRESYIKENGGHPVKNFERWLYQRDAPDYETEPAAKIEQAIQMWMVQPGKYYDYIARQGKKIGFDIDDRWAGLKDSIAIKISYIDNYPGKLNLVYNNGQVEIEKPLPLLGDNNLKTATFFISKLKANSLDHNFDFVLEAGENTDSITVSFVRIVHADVTSGQLGVAKKVFPDDAWGVYSWTQFTGIDKNSAPLVKGGPIIIRWANLEPQNGEYAFDKEIKDKLLKALDNDFYVFLKIYFAGPGSGFTPDWVFSNGVPRVNTDRGVFPYYFDEDYTVFYHRMIAKFGEYVLGLPDNLKERILFIQCTEGSTGDGGYYKGDPPAQYAISREEWVPFRLEAWKKFKAAFSEDDVLQFPLLTNDDANTPELRNWMLNELPMAIGVKNGMFTHGYQISDAQERLAEHFNLKKQAEAAGKVFFARGEMDAEMNEKGWITQNKKQGLYWSGIYATHCGITMWNMPQDAVKGDEYANAINFFNKYAGQLNPETAKGAFCAFYWGLDASDVTTFPENIYGTASKSNTQRYVKICNAFSQYGAGMADPAAATGGGMVNRDASGYND
ncbi:MAG TPA: hypothetical protein VLA03_02150, partial [Draconibacterium sp.]|nr:hypothetical protein [Draconibacterium sp.]